MDFGDNFTVYTAPDELSSPLPQNLTVDVPGGDFPAFSNVSIPNVGPLDISPASEETVNANTQFQWTGSAGATTSIGIDLTFGTLDVFCVVRDDGSFSFPANIRSQIGSSEATFVDYSRNAFSILTRGDSALFIFNSFEQ